MLCMYEIEFSFPSKSVPSKLTLNFFFEHKSGKLSMLLTSQVVSRCKATVQTPGQTSKQNMKKYISSAISSQQISAKDPECK